MAVAGRAAPMTKKPSNEPRNQHPAIVLKAYKSAIEERVDMRAQQQAVERVEPLDIGRDSPRLNMRRPEQVEVIYPNNRADSGPCHDQRASEVALA